MKLNDIEVPLKDILSLAVAVGVECGKTVSEWSSKNNPNIEERITTKAANYLLKYQQLGERILSHLPTKDNSSSDIEKAVKIYKIYMKTPFYKNNHSYHFALWMSVIMLPDVYERRYKVSFFEPNPNYRGK